MVIATLLLSMVSVASAAKDSKSGEKLRRRLASTQPSISPTQSPSFTEGVDPTKYNIELVFVGNVQDSVKQSFNKAKNRWESIITSDIPNSLKLKKNTKCFEKWASLPDDKIVDDLLIFVNVMNLDGPGNVLGEAAPCIQTNDPQTFARVGLMQFDIADVDELMNNGTFDVVVLHEMGHVIGIGSLWKDYKLVDKPCKNDQDAYYNGDQGLIGQAEVKGTGKPVVEADGGKGVAYVHWDEETYDNELMTGAVDANSKLSKLTIRSLQDLGYDVDITQADTYEIPSILKPSDKVYPTVRLGADIIRGKIVDAEADPY